MIEVKLLSDEYVHVEQSKPPILVREMSFPVNDEFKLIFEFMRRMFNIADFNYERNFYISKAQIRRFDNDDDRIRIRYLPFEFAQTFLWKYSSNEMARFLSDVGQFDGFDQETEMLIKEIGAMDEAWNYFKLNPVVRRNNIFVNDSYGYYAKTIYTYGAYLESPSLEQEELEKLIPKSFYSKSKVLQEEELGERTGNFLRRENMKVQSAIFPLNVGKRYVWGSGEDLYSINSMPYLRNLHQNLQEYFFRRRPKLDSLILKELERIDFGNSYIYDFPENLTTEALRDVLPIVLN